jgi:hypothetical protein
MPHSPPVLWPRLNVVSGLADHHALNGPSEVVYLELKINRQEMKHILNTYIENSRGRGKYSQITSTIGIHPVDLVWELSLLKIAGFD